MSNISNKLEKTPIKPAGARKSIFHPNNTDILVLSAMLNFVVSEETPKLQMDWIAENTKIEKSEVQRSIKWLNSAEKIETIGRGRGTHYKVLVETNDLTVATEEDGNYRKAGGPTVKQIVRAVFNGLEPCQRVSPAKINEISQSLFPESNLTRQSFGQVFTKMASAGELQFEGDGRSRKYWRGVEKLDGAAEVFDFDFDRFFDSEDTTTSTDEQETESEAVETYSDSDNFDDSDDFSDVDSDTSVAV